MRDILNFLKHNSAVFGVDGWFLSEYEEYIFAKITLEVTTLPLPHKHWAEQMVVR